MTVYQVLKRAVDNWGNIPIRVYQDGEWQSLFLSEVKNEKDKAAAVVKWLGGRMIDKPIGWGGRYIGPCQECLGKGVVAYKGKVRTYEMACPRCRGTGKEFQAFRVGEER
jgi:hypothetical protein